MATPVVYRYQQALDQFRRQGQQQPLLKRMSELISLLDLSSTLGAGLSGDEILDAALLIVMGELQAARGALLVRVDGARALVRAARGLPQGAPHEVLLEPGPDEGALLQAGSAGAEVLAGLGLDTLCPVLKAGRAIAWIGVGGRAPGAVGGEDEAAFLRSVAACAAMPIENGLIYQELKRVNQRLSVKVFQLNGLFDLSRELTAAEDEASVKELLLGALLGQLLVTRGALYLLRDGCFSVHARGLRAEEAVLGPLESAALLPALESLHGLHALHELADGPLRERLARQRLAWVAPLALGGGLRGFVALGERAARGAFAEEDVDFVLALGRQALAALDNVHLQRVRLEKLRQDRELQFAREIQQSLFPRGCPRVPGLEVAGDSRACYQVGGDLYDFVDLGARCLGLTIADVSGKGTPASLLMASVHAWMHALAGTVPAAELMRRLNRFLYESTQANRYVTLAYVEVDAAARRLRYVNAGHVPPYLLRAGGRLLRLEAGGPVLGLLPDAAYEAPELALEPGDVLVMVTDGATEALSCDEQEFGDERVVAAVRAAGDGPAQVLLTKLFESVHAWAGPGGCTDDLTALVLRVEG